MAARITDFCQDWRSEGVSYAISGRLWLWGRKSMALFNVLCFSTYLRPSSAISLRTVDLVPRLQEEEMPP